MCLGKEDAFLDIRGAFYHRYDVRHSCESSIVHDVNITENVKLGTLRVGLGGALPFSW